jgi:hypothetical protein
LNATTEAALLQEKSLSDNNPELPQTIKDAVLFCESIDIPYLWVYSLCIRQNDEEEKNSEIAHMHEIYSCAALTLVALNGSDSHAGLPGVRHGARKQSKD